MKEQLITATNWQKVIDEVVDLGDPNNNLNRLFMHLMPNTTEDWEYRTFANETAFLERWQEQLEAEGSLQEMSEAGETQEAVALEPNLKEAIEEWERLTRATFQYLSPGRERAAREAFPYSELSTLISLTISSTSSQTEATLPRPILLAIQNKTAQLFQAFDEADQARLTGALTLQKKWKLMANQLASVPLNEPTHYSSVTNAS